MSMSSLSSLIGHSCLITGGDAQVLQANTKMSAGYSLTLVRSSAMYIRPHHRSIRSLLRSRANIKHYKIGGYACSTYWEPTSASAIAPSTSFQHMTHCLRGRLSGKTCRYDQVNRRTALPHVPLACHQRHGHDVRGSVGARSGESCPDQRSLPQERTASRVRAWRQPSAICCRKLAGRISVHTVSM